MALCKDNKPLEQWVVHGSSLVPVKKNPGDLHPDLKYFAIAVSL